MAGLLDDDDIELVSVETLDDGDCVLLSTDGPSIGKGKGKAPANGSEPPPKRRCTGAYSGNTTTSSRVLKGSVLDCAHADSVGSFQYSNKRAVCVSSNSSQLAVPSTAVDTTCTTAKTSESLVPSNCRQSEANPSNHRGSSPDLPTFSFTSPPSSTLSSNAASFCLPTTSGPVSSLQTRKPPPFRLHGPWNVSSSLGAANTSTTARIQNCINVDSYVDADYQLALKLNEEINGPSALDVEFAQKLQDQEDKASESDDCRILADEKLARQLQEQQSDDHQQLVADLELARKLQEKEDEEAVKIIKATKVVVKPMPKEESSATSSSSDAAQDDDISTDGVRIGRGRSGDARRSPSPERSIDSGVGACGYGPSWWTICPKCPPDAVRHYHLIPVVDGREWQQVTSPLTNRGLTVTKLQRIQNAALWQRFQSERQLMRHGRSNGFSTNETLLYHTSQAGKEVICEEGLDQRLSRQGNFGTGIYFSDDPLKCDQYWRGYGKRIMFGCCVLLGDTKVYARGQVDNTLRREPPKPHARKGEHKTYDSVQGNVCGRNEYVVYNTYRVLPEYVIEYQHGRPAHSANILAAVAAAAAPPSTNYSAIQLKLQLLEAKLSRSKPPSKPQKKSITMALNNYVRAVPLYTVPATAGSMGLLERVQDLLDFVTKLNATSGSSAGGSSSSRSGHSGSSGGAKLTQ